MKRLGYLLLVLSFWILATVAISELTHLSLRFSTLISGFAAALVFLMLDMRSEPNPNDATIIRLTRGSRNRKKK